MSAGIIQPENVSLETTYVGPFTVNPQQSLKQRLNVKFVKKDFKRTIRWKLTWMCTKLRRNTSAIGILVKNPFILNGE